VKNNLLFLLGLNPPEREAHSLATTLNNTTNTWAHFQGSPRRNCCRQSDTVIGINDCFSFRSELHVNSSAAQDMDNRSSPLPGMTTNNHQKKALLSNLPSGLYQVCRRLETRTKMTAYAPSFSEDHSKANCVTLAT
jgi:hypothetical protein